MVIQVKLTWSLALGLELVWGHIQTKMTENLKRQRMNLLENTKTQCWEVEINHQVPEVVFWHYRSSEIVILL